MSGSYGAPKVYNPPQDVYSEAPNAFSEVAQSVYDAIRNRNTYPARRASPVPPVPPYNTYARTSGSHLPATTRPYPRATDLSPPLNPPSCPGAPPTISQQTMDGDKLCVSIDFGESSPPDFLPER